MAALGPQIKLSENISSAEGRVWSDGEGGWEDTGRGPASDGAWPVRVQSGRAQEGLGCLGLWPLLLPGSSDHVCFRSVQTARECHVVVSTPSQRTCIMALNKIEVRWA